MPMFRRVRIAAIEDSQLCFVRCDAMHDGDNHVPLDGGSIRSPRSPPVSTVVYH
jgi:hypothetical protein